MQTDLELYDKYGGSVTHIDGPVLVLDATCGQSAVWFDDEVAEQPFASLEAAKAWCTLQTTERQQEALKGGARWSHVTYTIAPVDFTYPAWF